MATLALASLVASASAAMARCSWTGSLTSLLGDQVEEEYWEEEEEVEQKLHELDQENIDDVYQDHEKEVNYEHEEEEIKN